MERYPSADANADCGNLVLGHFACRTARLLGSGDPDADSIFPSFAFDIESCQGGDDPGFEGGDESPQVGLASLQIEHDVGDALTWTVVGELAAAARLVNGKTPRYQITSAGGGSCCVKRRMFKQKYGLGRAAFRNRFGACFHAANHLVIRREPIEYMPLD